MGPTPQLILMYYLVYARKQAPTIVGIIEYHMLAPAKELYSDRD